MSRSFSKIQGYTFSGLTLLASLVIVAMLGVIVWNIFINGYGTLSWGFFTRAPEQGMTAGGIFPAIFGTVALVILMTIAVVPLGVLTAVYLHEYAKPDSVIARLVRAAVGNLAGVPSIVFGLFGLGFFVHFVGGGIDKLFYPGEVAWGQPAIIWAALTLAVLTLPVVIVSTEEALRAVPNEYREASYALGGSKWLTIRKIVLPHSVPGILTGAILAVGRGAGEVAPIMFTGAAYFLPYLPSKLNDQFMELGYHIFVMSTQSPDVEKTKPILYGTVLVLLILTFILNLLAILIRSKIRTAQRRAR
ncbi:MAG: phosphate ABC transporter permease PstA [candidate division Zixibacteria bacterium]|nr:phosphate ABC transporter permease PstA [candidate division Zixibacteria bacterium]